MGGHCCCINKHSHNKILPSAVEIKFRKKRLVDPFSKTSITDFNQMIDSITNINGEYIYFKDLKRVLQDKSDNWNDLRIWYEDSEIFKILMLYSPDILNNGKLSRISVLILGLLWCHGSQKEKSELVYSLSTSHMPLKERDEISRYNLGLKIVIETMIRFVCIYYQLYSFNIDPQSK